MVIKSEGWLEGGDKKLSTPKAKAALMSPWKMLLTVIRVPDEPTQVMPVLMF
jgi:hypothetical protein